MHPSLCRPYCNDLVYVLLICLLRCLSNYECLYNTCMNVTTPRWVSCSTLCVRCVWKASSSIVCVRWVSCSTVCIRWVNYSTYSACMAGGSVPVQWVSGGSAIVQCVVRRGCDGPCGGAGAIDAVALHGAAAPRDAEPRGSHEGPVRHHAAAVPLLALAERALPPPAAGVTSASCVN